MTMTEPAAPSTPPWATSIGPQADLIQRLIIRALTMSWDDHRDLEDAWVSLDLDGWSPLASDHDFGLRAARQAALGAAQAAGAGFAAALKAARADGGRAADWGAYKAAYSPTRVMTGVAVADAVLALATSHLVGQSGYTAADRALLLDPWRQAIGPETDLLTADLPQAVGWSPVG